MPILDKPISRAEYYASRVDKQRLDDKKAAAEARTRQEKEALDKMVGTPESAVFPNSAIEKKPPPYKDVYEVKTNTSNLKAGRYVLSYNSNRENIPEQSNNSSPKQSVFRRGYENLETYQANLREKKDELKGQRNTAYNIGQKVSTRAQLFGIGAWKSTTGVFVYPKETVVGAYRSVTHPKQAAKELVKEAKTDPWGFAGSFFGVDVLGKAAKGTGVVARNAYTGLTTKTVSSSKYLDVPSRDIVLKGGKAFPTSSSVGGALKKFELGQTSNGVRVTSVSPSPLKTLGQSRTIVVGRGTGVGRSEGLYASPYSQGSSFFFKVKQEGGYSFSVLPKFESSRPTLNLINVGNIKRQPKSVLREGVASENLFLQTQGVAGTNTAFITGNLERKFDKSLAKGFKTSETEVVIPTGSILKKVGRDKESFMFSYQRVRVKEYNLVGEGSTASGLRYSSKPFSRDGRFDSKSGTYYRPRKNVSLTGSYGRSTLSTIRYPNSPIYRSGRYPESPIRFPFGTFSSRVYVSKSSSRMGYSTSRGRYFSPNYASSKGNSRYNNSYSGQIITLKPDIKRIYPSRDSVSKPKEYFKRTSTIKLSYAPTVEATLFNVKGSSISKSYANTGLVLRPILRGKK